MSDADKKKREADLASHLSQHLNKLKELGVVLRCPVCKHNNFSVYETESAIPYRENEADFKFESLGRPVVARLPVICTRCFHMVEFAWLPILRGNKSV